MKAKEYLQQYGLLKLQLSDLQQKIAELNEEAESVNVAMDGMPHGTDISDKTGRLAVLIADITLRSIEKRDEIWRKREEITNVIRAVQDSSQYDVLYRRYVKGQRWEEIAVAMNYTYRNVTRIHGRGLETVQKMLDEREIEREASLEEIMRIAGV